MAFPIPDHPRPRFGIPVWVLLGLVAVIALIFGAVREYTSPRRAWHRLIRSSDHKVRSDAWIRVQRDRMIDGLDEKGTLQEVLASLDDPDPETRSWAIATLPAINVDPPLALARLSGTLRDPELSVRIKATSALGEVIKRGQPGREKAIEAVSVALKDADPQIRRAAVAALGQIVYETGAGLDPLRSGQPEDPGLNLVAERLLDDDPGVQVEAAYVLACNDRGSESVPMLAALVRKEPSTKPFGYVADRAFLALMVLAVNTDEAAAFFGEEMSAKREDYPDRPRDALAWAARQSTPAHARVKRLANKILKAEDSTLRHHAALLLYDIGAGESALTELISALSDPSVPTRIRAVEALADLGDINPAIVPALQTATNDTNPDVREHARGALELIEWDEIISQMSQ
jgi:HEAT repeat protein